MIENPRIAFFDSIADAWDGWEDLEAVHATLTRGLEMLGVRPSERVLDLGAGTGNLTRALCDHLSTEGRVVAVDVSPRMIERAQQKLSDERVTWLVEDGSRLSVSAGTLDRTICFSVWPHFDDPSQVAREMHRVLKIGGEIDVWHTLSRQRINEIHQGASEAVRHDLLPPAHETAALLERVGFSVLRQVDDAEQYLVVAKKTAA